MWKQVFLIVALTANGSFGGHAHHHKHASPSSSLMSSSSADDIDTSLPAGGAEPCEAIVSTDGLVDRILSQLPIGTPADVRQTIIAALSKIPGVEPPPPPAPPALNGDVAAENDTFTPPPPLSPETPQPTVATPELLPSAAKTPDSPAQISSHVSAFQRLLHWLGFGKTDQKKILKNDSAYHGEHSKEHEKEHHKKGEHHHKEHKEHHKESYEESHESKKHHGAEKGHQKPRQAVDKLLEKLGLSNSNESDESKPRHHKAKKGHGEKKYSNPDSSTSSTSSSSSSISSSYSQESKEHKGAHKHFGHRDSHELQKKYGARHNSSHPTRKHHKRSSQESAEGAKYKDAIKNLRHRLLFTGPEN